MKLTSQIVSLLKTEEEQLAFAGINLNPLVRWIKFVLTDDKPNANGQRIPKEEFANLIKTGKYMPVKTADAYEEKHHFNAEPIGAITHLKEDGDKIIGLAALWERERPEEVEQIVNMLESGEKVNLSWEIAYEKVEEEDDGTLALRGVALLGTTVVDVPAYQGRTPIVAVSEAEVWSREYINNLPDDAFLYIEPGGEKDEEGKTVPRSLRHLPYKDMEGNIDLPHLRNAIVRLSQKTTGKGWLTEELRQKLLEKARKILEETKKEESEMELEELKAQLEELQEKVAEYEKELEELRAYKEEAEREKAEAARFQAIKQKFEEAGVEKSEEYFNENREKLLAMSDEDIDFMLQELVAALAEAKKEEEKGRETSASLPDFSDVDEKDPIERARKLLRARK